jgi:hypothetical protein
MARKRRNGSEHIISVVETGERESERERARARARRRRRRREYVCVRAYIQKEDE